jgi:hypothetical protein
MENIIVTERTPVHASLLGIAFFFLMSVKFILGIYLLALLAILKV